MSNNDINSGNSVKNGGERVKTNNNIIVLYDGGPRAEVRETLPVSWKDGYCCLDAVSPPPEATSGGFIIIPLYYCCNVAGCCTVRALSFSRAGDTAVCVCPVE